MDIKHFQDFTRYEKAVGKLKTGSTAFKSTVAGVSHSVRLSRNMDNEHDRVIWNTGADIVGPMIFLFMWWVLEEAEKKEIDRVYFFARDGQIMLKVVDILKKEWGYKTDCRYLYGSRGSWLPPAIQDIRDFEWAWMSSGIFHPISINELCGRVKISPDKINDRLNEFGLGDVDKGKLLYGKELRAFKECIHDGTTKKLIIDNIEEEFERTITYFKQEGLCDGVPFAVVDIGWAGRCQYGLSSLLDKAGYYPGKGIRGFYLGISETKIEYKNDRYQHLMFDWTKEFIHGVLSQYMMYELLVSADHGRTTGYAIKENKAYPVINNVGVKESLEWGLMLHHEAAEEFAEKAVKHFDKESLEKDTAKIILRTLFSMLIGYPTREEAEIYGEYKIAAEMIDRDFQDIAPKMNYKELLAVALGHQKFKGLWPAGSFVRSEMRSVKLLLDIILKLGFFGLMKKHLLKCD